MSAALAEVSVGLAGDSRLGFTCGLDVHIRRFE